MIQLNSRIQSMLPCDGKKSIQYEKGRVIYIGMRALIEFEVNVCGHDGNGLGKPRKCWMVDFNKLREAQ